MEDLLKQHQEDQERIHALEKKLNVIDAQYQQALDRLREDVGHLQGCCDTITDLQIRITDTERKISSASENFDILQNRLDKELSGGGGSGNNENIRGVGSTVTGESTVVTEDRLDKRLKDLERWINKTVQQTEQSSSHLENGQKDFFYRELGDLRTVFLDQFDDQALRITAVELDMGLVKDQMSDHENRFLKWENNTSLLTLKLEECTCIQSGKREEGKPPLPDNRQHGTGGWSTGGRGGVTGETGGSIERGTQGGLSETGGERENITEKSLEWRVIANENQIRHFNTQLKDLSVSGDSLNHKVRNELSSFHEMQFAAKKKSTARQSVFLQHRTRVNNVGMSR